MKPVENHSDVRWLFIGQNQAMTYATTEGKEGAKGDDREQRGLRYLSKRGDVTPKSESERRRENKEIRVNNSLFCQHRRTCDTLAAIFLCLGVIDSQVCLSSNNGTDGEESQACRGRKRPRDGRG
jgi:hypothetical protein